jgi:hypothetical protein
MPKTKPAKPKQTPIRFTESDRKLLGDLQTDLGLPSIASLVRFLARGKARELGIPIPPGEPRQPGRPRKGSAS